METEELGANVLAENATDVEMATIVENVLGNPVETLRVLAKHVGCAKVVDTAASASLLDKRARVAGDLLETSVDPKVWTDPSGQWASASADNASDTAAEAADAPSTGSWATSCWVLAENSVDIETWEESCRIG